MAHRIRERALNLEVVDSRAILARLTFQTHDVQHCLSEDLNYTLESSDIFLTSNIGTCTGELISLILGALALDPSAFKLISLTICPHPRQNLATTSDTVQARHRSQIYISCYCNLDMYFSVRVRTCSLRTCEHKFNAHRAALNQTHKSFKILFCIVVPVYEKKKKNKATQSAVICPQGIT